MTHSAAPLPHYPRVPSPTPSSASSIPVMNIARDVSKSMLAAIPKYDGQGNAQKLYEYIQHVEEYLDLTELPAREQFFIGTHKLTGAARMMFRSHQSLASAADKVRDWEGVKRLLLQRFTTKEQQLLVRQQLLHIKQTGTVTDYTHHFDTLLMQLPQRDTEENYITLYLEGLKEEVRKAVSMNSEHLVSLLSLKSAALRYDQVVKPHNPRQQSTALTAQQPQDEKPGDDRSASLARGGGNGGGGGRGGGGGGRSAEWKKKHVRCIACHEMGHYVNECPSLAETTKKNIEEVRSKRKQQKNADEPDEGSAQTAFALTAYVESLDSKNCSPRAAHKAASVRMRRVGEPENGKESDESVTSPTERNGNRNRSRKCRANGKRTSNKFFDVETVGTADTWTTATAATMTAAEYAAVATIEDGIDGIVTELKSDSDNKPQLTCVVLLLETEDEDADFIEAALVTAAQTIVSEQYSINTLNNIGELTTLRIDGTRAKELASDTSEITWPSLHGCVNEEEAIQLQHHAKNIVANFRKPSKNLRPSSKPQGRPLKKPPP
ncbi:hypothetical protein HK104_003598 [Borealophlyctis nickersoniae]|nr:hypothetical protein HK104_003598 [Borealophlyctis nickersoniae]